MGWNVIREDDRLCEECKRWLTRGPYGYYVIPFFHGEKPKTTFVPAHGWMKGEGEKIHAVLFVAGNSLTICEIAKMRSMMKGSRIWGR